MRSNIGSYWNDYYSTSGTISYPSQFAAFVLGEIGEIRNVVDIGCGSGRDCFFFSNFNLSVIGVDASKSAIEACNVQRERCRDDRSHFIESSIADSNFVSLIRSRSPGIEKGPTLIYSRFFLHAIEQDDQDAFFEASSSLINGNGMLALEFRTEKDASQKKLSKPHYRRFLKTSDVICQLARFGLATTYFTEGFGLAKHKQEDPHIARLIACPIVRNGGVRPDEASTVETKQQRNRVEVASPSHRELTERSLGVESPPAWISS